MVLVVRRWVGVVARMVGVVARIRYDWWDYKVDKDGSSMGLSLARHAQAVPFISNKTSMY